MKPNNQDIASTYKKIKWKEAAFTTHDNNQGERQMVIALNKYLGGDATRCPTWHHKKYARFLFIGIWLG